MQINTSLQPVDYSSVLEKVIDKPEKPEVKIKNDFDSGSVSNKDSKKLEQLTAAFEENNISLTFSQDKDTKALIVKLVDKITGEEIRQIPTEVSLKLAAINAKVQGNFLDEKS